MRRGQRRTATRRLLAPGVEASHVAARYRLFRFIRNAVRLRLAFSKEWGAGVRGSAVRRTRCRQRELKKVRTGTQRTPLKRYAPVALPRRYKREPPAIPCLAIRGSPRPLRSAMPTCHAHKVQRAKRRCCAGAATSGAVVAVRHHVMSTSVATNVQP